MLCHSQSQLKQASGRRTANALVLDEDRKGQNVAHVLVVDDDADIRISMRSLLEDIGGYTVIEAPDGLEALKILRASEDPLVVLLDLLMPGLDGMGVLREVAADEILVGKHTYVLVTVSRQEQPLAFSSNFALEVPVVSKPFDMDELLSVVAESERKISDH